MAWMNQEKKQLIAARVKAVTPKNWRVTFKVRHHSTLECTIRRVDVDIMAAINEAYKERWERDDGQGPLTHIQSLDDRTIELLPSALREPLENMYKALNSENYDRSDIMTDYFDVGYYAYLSVGEFSKPVEVVLR